jgi:hypothetical protein
MAGFRKETPWFVPRVKLPLEFDISDYERWLLPTLPTLRAQAATRHGDHSSCCDNFLNETLPFLIEVLVQDGIYFIVEFPNHPMSQLLKVSTTCTTVLFCTGISTTGVVTNYCAIIFYWYRIVYQGTRGGHLELVGL